MDTTTITPEDWQNFKQELLAEIRQLISQRQVEPSKRWLKSSEVLELLSISNGTLQTFRNKGTLPFSKVGGVIFYDYDDIQKIIEKNKQDPHLNLGEPNP
jgi:predicted DNA-binding transcriptional regulator AlpA